MLNKREKDEIKSNSISLNKIKSQLKSKTNLQKGKNNMKRNNSLMLILVLASVLLGSISFNGGLRSIDMNSISKSKINLPNVSAYTSWEKIYGSSLREYGQALKIDLNGKIFVASYVLNNSFTDSYLFCLDNQGNYEWNVSWGGDAHDQAYDIAIDSYNDIYVAGTYNNESGITNAFVIKFDNSGNYLGNATWGGNYQDSANAISIDSEDNFYITGSTQSFNIDGDSDTFIAKYNRSLNLIWSKVIPGGAGSANFGRDMVIDNNNYVYLVGNNISYPSGFASYDVFIAKYNSTGKQVWNRTWGTSDDEDGYGITLDSQNNIYILGSIGVFGLAPDLNVSLVKFNNFGNEIWNVTWDRDLSVSFDFGSRISIDSKDFIYISGATEHAPSEFNSTLFKYNSSGNLIWMEEWGGGGDELGKDIYIDNASDNIYLTGTTTSFSSGGDEDIFLLKYIEYRPGELTLSTNAENPDDDGVFNLSWTSSIRANNYSLYRSNTSCILDIEAEIPWIETLHNNSIEIGPIPDGEYYFLIVARNNIGNETSNCLTILVEETITPSPNGGEPPVIPGFNLVTLITSVAIIVYIKLIKKLKMKKVKTR